MQILDSSEQKAIDVHNSERVRNQKMRIIVVVAGLECSSLLIILVAMAAHLFIQKAGNARTYQFHQNYTAILRSKVINHNFTEVK